MSRDRRRRVVAILGCSGREEPMLAHQPQVETDAGKGNSRNRHHALDCADWGSSERGVADLQEFNCESPLGDRHCCEVARSGGGCAAG